MLGATIDELKERGQAYLDRVPGSALVESDAYVGGGSLPNERIGSIAVAVEADNANHLAARLRDTIGLPIVGRVDRDRFLLDLRTIFPEFDRSVIRLLNKALTK